MADMNSEQDTIRFCSYCGSELDKNAKFCKNCGKPIKTECKDESSKNNPKEETFKHEPYTERENVYEGNLHKCPRCGEILDSFITKCPACGHEIRDSHSSNAVREFALKLEKIESEKMPDFKEKKSVMKMVFGRDFREDDEVEGARYNWEKQKEQEKANLIINFSVPNNKEDIVEFMLLASSNIDVKGGIDDVTKAWISKLEQVYNKAKISMNSDTEFFRIKNIYDQKMKEIKSQKICNSLSFIGPLILCFLVFSLIEYPIATISIVVVIVILSVIGFVLYRKKINK